MRSLKKVLLILMIIIMDIVIFSNVVSAISNNEGKVQVYKAKKLSTSILKDEKEVEFNYLYHNIDGEKMPVYYLEEEPLDYFPDSRNIDILGELKRENFSKILANGYPFKSSAQLGCINNEEAYMATQGAIFCNYQEGLLEKYIAKDEKGQRILNAINKILEGKSTLNKMKATNKLEIKKQNLYWEDDEKDKNYVSKTYKIETESEIKNYKIYLKNNEGKILEGIKVVDKNNQEKEKFEGNEEFKIIVPKEKIKDINNFEIDAEAQVYAESITEGIAGKELTNYAILEKYEKCYGSIQEKYENKVLPITGK